jgi:hypothetical protein
VGLPVGMAPGGQQLAVNTDIELYRADAWTKLRTAKRGAFDRHWIRESVETPTFASWLLQARDDNHLWCRVSAGHAFVSVFGDFGPTAFVDREEASLRAMHFAYGSRGPRALIHWIARATGSYLVEKAIIGTGREAILEHSSAFAKEDLLATREDRVQEVLEDGEQPSADRHIRAIDAGLDTRPQRDGEPGVCEIVDAMTRVCWDATDMLPSQFGARPTPHVFWARDAIRRLAWLL